MSYDEDAGVPDTARGVAGGLRRRSGVQTVDGGINLKIIPRKTKRRCQPSVLILTTLLAISTEREHDFCNFTYHFKMGPKKFGNQDSYSREALGTPCYTGDNPCEHKQQRAICHDLKEELVVAVEDVRKQGETMRIASSEFADDPCSSVKRGTMVRAARALLSAVTRLLILADMADVMRLLSHLKIVEEALEAVKNATNEQDLANRFKEFGKEMVKLNYVAARRQQELKDPHCRDEMAAARGALKKNATMLYTASQAFLRHPDVAATRANRDYVFKQVQEAIAGISNAAQATSPTDENKGHTGIGELAAALNEFDNKIILDPMTFSEARFRPSLEERLESIISGAALMADSSCTRDDRRERIVAECNAVRQALQDLLSEYMNNKKCGNGAFLTGVFLQSPLALGTSFHPGEDWGLLLGQNIRLLSSINTIHNRQAL
ncbi:unnamed protein product [Caretta caretta]